MSVDLTSFQLSFVVLKHISYPAKPNSFIALASQLRVSAWFFGFFCANAKDTTWKKIISRSSIWLLLYRTFQKSFDWLGERKKKRPVLQSTAMNKPLQWLSELLWHSLRIWHLPLYPPDHPEPLRLTSWKTVLFELLGPRCGASSASPIYIEIIFTNSIFECLFGQFSTDNNTSKWS